MKYAFILTLFLVSNAQAKTVKGYIRDNGNYVDSYERSAPNDVQYDNYNYEAPKPSGWDSSQQSYGSDNNSDSNIQIRKYRKF